MPDVTIAAPVAADSIDRLSLGMTDARTADSAGPQISQCSAGVCFCAADE